MVRRRCSRRIRRCSLEEITSSANLSLEVQTLLSVTIPAVSLRCDRVLQYCERTYTSGPVFIYIVAPCLVPYVPFLTQAAKPKPTRSGSRAGSSGDCQCCRFWIDYWPGGRPHR